MDRERHRLTTTYKPHTAMPTAQPAQPSRCEKLLSLPVGILTAVESAIRPHEYLTGTHQQQSGYMGCDRRFHDPAIL